jgi:hypothetical protein
LIADITTEPGDGRRGARTISYVYKASLISSAYQFELTDSGLVVADRPPVRRVVRMPISLRSVCRTGRCRCNPADFAPISNGPGAADRHPFDDLADRHAD